MGGSCVYLMVDGFVSLRFTDKKEAININRKISSPESSMKRYIFKQIMCIAFRPSGKNSVNV